MKNRYIKITSCNMCPFRGHNGQVETEFLGQGSTCTLIEKSGNGGYGIGVYSWNDKIFPSCPLPHLNESKLKTTT
jgi:hypothetical protein